MNPFPVRIIALAFIVLGLGAAIWAGPNVATAVPAAALAAVAAVGIGGFELSQRLRSPPATLPVPSGDPLVQLRGAFSRGTLGRQSIVDEIGTLYRELGGNRSAPLTVEEERSLLRLSPAQFRRWVDAQLHALETGT